MFKFIYSIKLYFKYESISKFFRMKIFNIGKYRTDLRKRFVKKGFAINSRTLQKFSWNQKSKKNSLLYENS